VLSKGSCFKSAIRGKAPSDMRLLQDIEDRRRLVKQT
jgi:hypothetical protein